MAVVILPDAQNDLLSLQEYMLDQWSERDWIKAEEEIFDKLERVDREGFPGTLIGELSAAGILEYLSVLTSHHRVIYRKINGDTYVYAIAGYGQDFSALLQRRLANR